MWLSIDEQRWILVKTAAHSQLFPVLLSEFITEILTFNLLRALEDVLDGRSDAYPLRASSRGEKLHETVPDDVWRRNHQRPRQHRRAGVSEAEHWTGVLIWIPTEGCTPAGSGRRTGFGASAASARRPKSGQ